MYLLFVGIYVFNIVSKFWIIYISIYIVKRSLTCARLWTTIICWHLHLHSLQMIFCFIVFNTDHLFWQYLMKFRKINKKHIFSFQWSTNLHYRNLKLFKNYETPNDIRHVHTIFLTLIFCLVRSSPFWKQNNIWPM